jgi:hypothetical protein
MEAPHKPPEKPIRKVGNFTLLLPGNFTVPLTAVSRSPILRGKGKRHLACDSPHHRLRGDLARLRQGALLKVGVALGHSWATMSQELLHNVEADPAVNEVAGVAVTQIMQAHIPARPARFRMRSHG